MYFALFSHIIQSLTYVTKREISRYNQVPKLGLIYISIHTGSTVRAPVSRVQAYRSAALVSHYSSTRGGVNNPPNV